MYPARERESHQFHAVVGLATVVQMLAKHHGPDLHVAHATLDVQRIAQDPRRVVCLRHLRQHGSGIEIDGVPAGWLDETDAGLLQLFAQVFSCAQRVAQVVFLHRLFQPDGQRNAIAPGQTTKGGEALPHDEHFTHRLQPLVGAQNNEAADFDHAILLGAHGRAVGLGKHLVADGSIRRVLVTRFAQLDEHRILGEAAHNHDQRLAMALEQRGVIANIGHRHRLPASDVVGHRDHAERNLVRIAPEQCLGAFQIDIAFKRMDQLWLQSLGDHQITSVDTDKFEVGTRRIKVAIIRHDLSCLGHGGEQYLLGGPARMDGNEIRYAGDVVESAR